MWCSPPVTAASPAQSTHAFDPQQLERAREFLARQGWDEAAIDALTEGSDEFALPLAERLVDLLPVPSPDRAHAELHLETLRVCLSAVAVGDAEDWFELTLERASLANDYAVRLASVRRHAEALRWADESVELARAVLTRGPEHAEEHGLDFDLDRARWGLQTALNNASNRLAEAGQHGRSLAFGREAVELARLRLAESPQPLPLDRQLRQDLALALMNVGASLYDQRQIAAALEPTDEALALYRALAADHPDDPGLAHRVATTSSNLGVYRSALDDHEAAFEHTREAAEVLRRIVAEHPDAPLVGALGFGLDFALLLDNLGFRALNLGEREAAIEAWREALPRHREVAERAPELGRDYLSRTLLRLADHLHRGERHAEAVDAYTEAVEVLRALAEASESTEQAQAWRSKLGRALSNLGIALCELDTPDARESSLAATREAVVILRELDEREHLIRALSNLAKDLDALDRVSEGVAPRAEAIAALEAQIAADDGDDSNAAEDHLGELADELGDQALSFDELGQREAARDCAGRAVAAARALLEHDPEYYAPELARALDVAATVANAGGDHARALEAAAEALRLLLDGGDEAEDEGLVRDCADSLSEAMDAGGLEAPADLRAWLDARAE